MTTEQIELHSDNMLSTDAHPAINVKVQSFPSDLYEAPEDVRERAWESVREGFWEEATELAHERGYSGLFSEGRSGGWMLPFYQRTADGRTKFYNWPGQGGALGYPRYPDVTQIGERSRFLAFQRRVQAMLDSVPDRLRDQVKYELDEIGEDN